MTEGAIMPLLNKVLSRLTLPLLLMFLAVFAVYLFQGLINPTRVDWLLFQAGDLQQHFLGWHAFRSEPWHWPLGSIQTFASELKTSIVFTDSVPWLALPLKLFSEWLPAYFQLQGLVTASSVVLNGFFAYLLVKKAGHTAFAAACIALLLALLPASLMRGVGGMGHEALTVHWLLLAGFYCFLFPLHSALGRHLLWCLLLCVAVLTHFYLFFMSGFLWFAAWLMAWQQRPAALPSHAHRAHHLAALFWVPALVAGVMWAAGYFYVERDAAASGYFGVFSSELLSFFNPWAPFGDMIPGYSRFFPGWHPPLFSQYEGQAYLGLGGLLLLMLGLHRVLAQGVQATWSQAAPAWRLLFILCLFMALFSLGTRLGIGMERGFKLPLPWPEVFKEALRANGRFMWPLMYFALIASSLFVFRHTAVWKTHLALFLLLCVQLYDLSPMFKHLHAFSSHAQTQTRYDSQQFEYLYKQDLLEVYATRSEIRLFPAYAPEMYQHTGLTWLAQEQGLSINVGYVARISDSLLEPINQRNEQELLEEGIHPQVIYAVTDTRWIERLCQTPQASCYSNGVMTLVWSEQAVPLIHQTEE